MVTRVKTRRRTSAQKPWRLADPEQNEALAYCPACKALEVMRFSGNVMTPTRNFAQKPDGVYHSCGTGVPCRLFRAGTRPPPLTRRLVPGLPLRPHKSRRAVPAAVG